MCLGVRPAAAICPVTDTERPEAKDDPVGSPIFLLPIHVSMRAPGTLVNPPLTTHPDTVSSVAPMRTVGVAGGVWKVEGIVPPRSSAVWKGHRVFPVPATSPVRTEVGPIQLLGPSHSFSYFPVYDPPMGIHVLLCAGMLVCCDVFAWEGRTPE